ncbi:procathepsin L-like [Babylonia areolata]|uniref:procathepsin L-like n=1 Tax=Babylonia areolata TaxID=304850 RepID=UPI003FD3E891
MEKSKFLLFNFMCLWLPLLGLALPDVIVDVTRLNRDGLNLRNMFKREGKWVEWKRQHGKVYATRQEEAERRSVFLGNLQTILQHNARYPDSVTFYQSLSSLSDLTGEDFSGRTNLSQPSNLVHMTQNTFQPVPGFQLPSTVDWRSEGFVSPVKTQGDCDSSWAFSAAGSIEGQHFNKTGKLVSLSVQQLLDCSQMYGTNGCHGGTMDAAFSYTLLNRGGLFSEEDYPYTAAVHKECRQLTPHAAPEAPIRGFVRLPPSETTLQQAIAMVGPVAAAVDASPLSFRHYSGGVYQEASCSSDGVNQAVLVVGYGTYQGQDYWLLKNSWGPDWGMNGYMMLARNQGNMCGISTMASYPLV